MAVYFQKPEKNGDTIELTPLIDVIFQLLIFFMLTSTFLYPSLELELPRAEFHQRSNEAPTLVVSIEAAGGLFLDRDPVDETTFRQAVSAKLKEGRDARIFLNADKAVPYDRIIEVMRMASESGMTKINFLYEPEE